MADTVQYSLTMQLRTIAAEEGGPQLLCAQAVDVAPRIQVVQQQQHQVQRRVHAHLGPQRHSWTPRESLWTDVGAIKIRVYRVMVSFRVWLCTYCHCVDACQPRGAGPDADWCACSCEVLY